ncbi:MULTISPECIES: hypothetical protein [Bacillaceae]|uniref:Uncharacterized protein n=1 Tax=Cytobacillus oceanisediminis 2691 TaxID=1196031 RepID=A0A161JBR7_9BACI|nr:MULTISPECIES: hypothetical protein [Bacillaceae]AND40651.1 hypothetical protein A361_16315 [Cytobacillus oceanisediminis 2691]PAE23872.1 hypothetical protein CHI10_15625 [Bacillus sp. 7894-2]QOK29144.1 hypothetical protein IIE26_10980 [Cytobacillus oceanisediminis]
MKGLFKRALLYRLLTNLDVLISKAKLSHKEVSSRTGRKGNWINDAYNQSEDIQISSLAKIFSVINTEIDLNGYSLSAVFDDKVLDIARVISNLSDEEENSAQIAQFVSSEEELLIDLLGDWGSLESKRKLNKEELSYFREIKKLINQQASKEDSPDA